MGLLIAPQLSRDVLEFTPVNKRVASLCLRVKDRSLCSVCLWAERQFRVPCPFGVSGKGAGKYWGPCRSTGGLQRPRGQRQ